MKKSRLWNNQERKFLICGCMFSGTSIVASILGSHSQVAVISEWAGPEKRIIGKPYIGVKLITFYQLRKRQIQKYIDEGYEIIWVWRDYDSWIESWRRQIKGRKWYWRLFWLVMPKERLGFWYYTYDFNLQSKFKTAYIFSYLDFKHDKKIAISKMFYSLKLIQHYQDIYEQAVRCNYAHKHAIDKRPDW